MNSDNNTFIDSGPNAFAIVKNGNVGQGSYAPLLRYWSLQALKSGDYLYVPPPGDGSLDPGATGAWTLEGWFLLHNLVPGTLVSIGNLAAHGNAAMLKWEGGVFSFAQENGVGTVVTLTSNSPTPWGGWHHVAVSKDSSGTIRMFVDGLLVGSKVSTVALVTECGLVVNGRLDNLGVGNNGMAMLAYGVHWIKGRSLYTVAFDRPMEPPKLDAASVTLTCTSNRFIDTASGTALTVGGGASIQPIAPFMSGYSPATYGGSLHFNGTDWLDVAADPALDLPDDFTITFWMYPTKWGTGTPTQGTVVSKGAAYRVYVAKGVVSFAFGTTVLSTNTNSISLNQWSHVAVVRSGGTYQIYVNGMAARPLFSTPLQPAATTDNLMVGRGSTGAYFCGYIADLHVATSALYTTAFTPYTTPPVATASTQLLLRGTNAGVPNLTNTSDIATLGTAHSQTSVFKKGDSALYFNGTTDSIANYDVTHLANQLSGKAFTIDFWLYPTAYGAPYRGVMGATTVADQGWAIVVGSSYIGWVSNNNILVNTSLTLNVWTHFAFVYNGSTMSLYKDGFRVVSPTTTAWANTTDVFEVGVWRASNLYFKGYMDDVRIALGVQHSSDFDV